MHGCVLSAVIFVRYTRGNRMFNKTFYKFVFGFVAVIAVTLLAILIVGVGAK